MENIAIENSFKRLFEHAGHDEGNKLGGYDIVLTADTVGSAAGDVVVTMWFAQA